MSHYERSCAREVGRWRGAAIAGLLGALLAATAPAAAQNLLGNGSFHENVLEWDLELGLQILWTDLAEEGDCSNSGSALIVSEPTDAGEIAMISQCVAIGDVTELYAGVRHQGYGEFRLELTLYTAFNCTTGVVGSIAAIDPQSPLAWSQSSVGLAVPASANAATVRISADDADPHGLSVDEVILTPLPWIFLDGFDGNDPGETLPCRWSPFEPAS